MKTIALFASISIASGLMFANVYTSLVDAKSWGSDIPGSIAAAREYFKTVSPANFFRILSPLNQVLALAVLVLFWKSSSPIRMCLAAALVLYVLTDVMTFAYFYPRNEIMFRAAQLNDVTLLRETWASWSAMNWVRSSILLAGVILSCVSLHKIYSIDGQGRKPGTQGLTSSLPPGHSLPGGGSQAHRQLAHRRRIVLAIAA